MNYVRVAPVALLLTAALAVWGLDAAARGQSGSAADLAVQTQGILQQHCLDCHGKDTTKKPKGDLKILDHRQLLQDERAIVVPRKPEKSKLIEVIRDGSMPSGKRPKVPEKQIQVLEQWIKAGAPAFGGSAEVVARGTVVAAAGAGDIGPQVEAVFKKHCFVCHGQDPKKVRGDLKILDHAALLDKEKKLVVPGKPRESGLFDRITTSEEESMMPPKSKPRPAKEEIALVEKWIAAGAPSFDGKGGEAVVRNTETVRETSRPVGGSSAGDPNLAAHVKEIFRTHCSQCHGKNDPRAGLQVLDYENLVTRKHKVVPGDIGKSAVVKQILSDDDGNRMPPSGQPRLSADDAIAIVNWVQAGAPRFPDDQPVPEEKDKDRALKGLVGVDHVLKAIRDHVRSLDDVGDKRYARYFSINHLLVQGATKEELDLHREALAEAINHLSWQRQLVIPKPIDEPDNTVFYVDIRRLGWHDRPYTQWRGTQNLGYSNFSIFDVALLEYPYGVLYQDSAIADQLYEEYLKHAGMVRPIPYVRADWFCSVVTQPPLYEDFMQLPLTRWDLERRLGVDSLADIETCVARRAGMTVSGVSRNNRVVERHPAQNSAYYWLSYDFKTSKGRENMFIDPVNFEAAGGEMIFGLPNGLQGYYLADGKGARLAAGPTQIVTDKFAEDKTVRNGLACIRCHDQGMKTFEDRVRPSLDRLPGNPGFDKARVRQLYADEKEMKQLVDEDSDRFRTALQRLLGVKELPRQAPLTPVSKRFIDGPIPLETATAELGLPSSAGLQTVLGSPQFGSLGLTALTAKDGVVRRDTWEDYYDQVVRLLGIGMPVIPLDGVTRPDYQSAFSRCYVDVKTVGGKKGIFSPGDKCSVVITNRSRTDIYVELVGTATDEKMAVITRAPVLVRPGQDYTYGPVTIEAKLGKEKITVYASENNFPCGEVLRFAAAQGRQYRGMGDRVVHRFYDYARGGRLAYDPSLMVKKTIEIETR